MGDFVGTDPRGYMVVLRDSALNHAKDEGHLVDIPNAYTLTLNTLRRPDLIAPNPNTFRTQRRAYERYVAFHEEINLYLVVPVTIISEPEVARGYGTIPAGTRVVTTIYSSEEKPSGPYSWTKT